MPEGSIYHVYCDESRQTRDRFMVFGGIVVGGRRVGPMNEAIGLWRDAHEMHAELKWIKVSGQKLPQYKALVDLFFSFAGAGPIHFKSIVFDTSQIDYETYHKGDKELGFYKLFYTFLLHKLGPYLTSDEDRVLIFFHRRTTKYKLSTFQAILNNGIRKKYGVGRDVVRSVQALGAHGSDILQLADVLMGAIGYQFNDYHLRPSARQAKVALADYIASKANLLSLKQSTPKKTQHFEIWPFRFSREGKEKAP